MKNTLLSLFLVVAAALPLPSLAQSVQDNCNAVTNAAVAGRNQANDRIRNIENAVQQQAATMRSCLERFSDAASRQALVIGGFDLSPLRDRLMDRACNMIVSQVNQAASSVSTQLPQIPSSVSQVLQTPGILPQPGGSTQQGPASIWDRIACSVSGNC